MQNPCFGHVFRAEAPVLVVTPHCGTEIPDDLLDHLAWQPIRGRLADPVGDALRERAAAHGISTVTAHLHPCVIDYNVPALSRTLSLRMNRGGLCRTHTSRGESLYEPDQEPTEAEVQARIDAYWRPFHIAVSTELQRLRERHANVLLVVSHASYWLSPYRNHSGALDCNVGTHFGTSCDRRLVSALTETVGKHGRSWVVNGKVADVFAAQHYGAPDSGIHAIEIEFGARWRMDLETARDSDGAQAARESLDGLLDGLGRHVMELNQATPGRAAHDAGECPVR